MQSMKKAKNYYSKLNRKAMTKISSSTLLQTLVMLRKLSMTSINATHQSLDEQSNKQSNKQLIEQLRRS